MASIADQFPQGSQERGIASDIEDATRRIFEQYGGYAGPPGRPVSPHGPSYSYVINGWIGICDACEKWFPICHEDAPCPTLGCEGEVLIVERMEEPSAEEKKAFRDAAMREAQEKERKRMGETRYVPSVVPGDMVGLLQYDMEQRLREQVFSMQHNWEAAWKGIISGTD